MDHATYQGHVDDAGDGPIAAELPRLAQILRALVEAGWARYLEWLRVRRDAFDTESEVAQTIDHDAKRFREMLEQLGPAYVKFAELLSLRRDRLPEYYIDELQRLQDDNAILSGAQA
ncbi:2-octaprenylphenol hydroxylase [Caballeronia arationis]|uniref:hypothetical protein n=1 Tax=Caballeronia arationis TaxID=1777142 RepID=UPI00074C46F4|nr:hypothetical protein [Caballeronia arationis]SAL02668.1 2-octaprenylphenol hydroxylase [Caballeronia arationis]